MANRETPLRSMREYDIFEKGFGHYIHKDGLNIVKTVHHHDYYELVFYLGDDPMRFYYEGENHTIHKGDIAICAMFDDHQFVGIHNDGFYRISIGVTSDMLIKCSHEDSNLFLIFTPKHPHFPVFRPNLAEDAKYMKLLADYLSYDDSPNRYVIQRAMVHMILANLYSDFCGDILEDTTNYGQLRLVSDIIEYVDKNIAKPITVEEIAESVNYSNGYTSKAFKQATGESLNRYILKKRIEKADYLIRNGMPIVEASEHTGFENYSYFYKAFKKIKGITPKEYQTQINASGIETAAGSTAQCSFMTADMPDADNDDDLSLGGHSNHDSMLIL